MMIRSVRPTDLLVLLAFNTQPAVNEAKTWKNFLQAPEVPLPWDTFLQEWLSLDEDRHTWVSLERRQIKGLVSVRHRTGPRVWEIARLLFLPQEANGVCLSLLDYVSAVGAEVGIHKVFLRLSQKSPLLEDAQLAGFTPYTTQTLFLRASPKAPLAAAPSMEGLRPRVGRDENSLFRLYCAAVPVEVRRAEAMTIQEWREAQERCPRPWGTRELVLERGAEIVAWARIVSRGRFETLVHPEQEGVLEELLPVILAQLQGKPMVLCLVPPYQVRLERLLQEEGFHASEEYSCLVKQLTVRVKVPRLVPAHAS